MIFPDDGGEQAVLGHNDSAKVPSTSTTIAPTNVVSPVELRTILEPATSRGILFPDENGNFKMPSNRIVGMSENATQRALLLKNKERLLPKPSVCGPISLGDKIHGGIEAELGEFPWLVNLEYRTGKCVHIERLRNISTILCDHKIASDIKILDYLQTINKNSNGLWLVDIFVCNEHEFKCLYKLLNW